MTEQVLPQTVKEKNIAGKIYTVINQNNQLKIGSLLLLFLILIGVFAPLLSTYSPTALGDGLLVPPSAEHWLGTDKLGRDLYSMILYGTRTSLMVGFVSAIISGIIGTIIGAYAGFYGGKVERFLTEVNNIFLMMPTFFLILLVAALFGNSLVIVMVIIGLTGWASNARLMRAQALSIRERTFIKSSIAIGEKKSLIIFKHIIPNGIFPIIANTTMNISGAILIESSLSFIGLGDPNIISWGQIVFDGRSYMTSGWWVSAFSGFMIVITVLSFYLIGDGLNKVINPKLK
ncbi:peptide transporter [Paenibacillus sp. 7884-2]|nr:peptide transporter [Paenibacillus sp. 7884-2]